MSEPERRPPRPDRLADTRGRARLLQWGFIFLLAAGIAALFGFGEIRPNTAEVGRWFFYLFMVLAVGSFVLHVDRRRRSGP